MYSNVIPSRAGLVALVFALIISLVSAAPIPIPISTSHSGLSPALSSRSNRDAQGLIRRDTQLRLNGQISTVSITTRALTVNNAPAGVDSQIVRRSIGSKIKAAFSKVGNAIKHVAQKIGSGIKSVAQKVGSGIKSVAQKVGSGIKSVAQKVGSGVKTAAKTVGTFMKHTGAKIAKFGLKVYATVTKVAAKVASFIPVIGKPLGKAMEGVSEAANFASDKIHANLGKKLEKGMNVMNKANKIMGYMPRRRELSEEDLGLWQRDVPSVEHREEPYFDVEVREQYLEWE